jgi:hypothetical protein
VTAASRTLLSADAALHGIVPLDEIARGDHPYLSAADHCCCLAEYLPGAGYSRSQVNQLIANLKCLPSLATANPLRARHKCRAIAAIAGALRRAVGRRSAECSTWVPIPPSRMARDCDYDDRLERVLSAAFAGYDFDLRLLLYQAASTAADHAQRRRLSPDRLYELIRVDAQALRLRPLRECIVLFDDVLTTGKHFKCCERRLREASPQVAIRGLFVARRVLPRRRCGPWPRG